MLVPDVNVILNASFNSLSNHLEAKAWYERVRRGNELVGIPDLILSAFVRIATNSRVFPDALSALEAFEICDRWRSMDQYLRLEASSSHWDAFQELIGRSNVTGPGVADAYIAAFAVDHKATLVTFDRGFARYPDLTWIQPEA